MNRIAWVTWGSPNSQAWYILSPLIAHVPICGQMKHAVWARMVIRDIRQRTETTSSHLFGERRIRLLMYPAGHWELVPSSGPHVNVTEPSSTLRNTKTSKGHKTYKVENLSPFSHFKKDKPAMTYIEGRGRHWLLYKHRLICVSKNKATRVLPNVNKEMKKLEMHLRLCYIRDKMCAVNVYQCKSAFSFC